jgi:hypothetical protein
VGGRFQAAPIGQAIEPGVEPHRIQLISYGKERPVCAEDSDACGPATGARTFS